MNPVESEQTRWFTEEVNPHGPALRAYLALRFPLLADIDNVVQESFVRVLGARAKGPVESAKALLFAIGRNLALDAMRREQRVSFEPISEVPPSFALIDTTDVAEFVSKQGELDLLREAIEALPPRCRQVLRLRTVHGCSQRQIAQKLQISENAVEKQLSNGLRLCEAYFAARNAF